MSLGIWENLNFDLNNFKCVVKGFLKTDKGRLINNIEDDATVFSNLLSNNINIIISVKSNK